MSDPQPARDTEVTVRLCLSREKQSRTISLLDHIFQS
jgi:hypothetical protein